MAAPLVTVTLRPIASGTCRCRPPAPYCDNLGRRPSHSSLAVLQPMPRHVAEGNNARGKHAAALLGSPSRGGVAVRSQSTDFSASTQEVKKGKFGVQGVHHIALIVDDLKRSLHFYCDTLGLSINPDRPHDKLPYDGAWLWIGPEMIHLMELPNPDPMEGRPTHGGRDRHFCVGVESVAAIVSQLEDAGIQYTASKSGRPAIFFRDPDMNTIECVEIEAWRPGV